MEAEKKKRYQNKRIEWGGKEESAHDADSGCE